MNLATLGKDPIAGDHPAGSDIRYDPDFEVLQAEIDKLSSPTAAGGTDWSKIMEKAADILAAKSKDLTVAGYLAVGLLRNRGLGGLDEGLQIIRDLVEYHWDHLYPPKKRMRGRQGALTWWLEKTEGALQQLKINDPLPAEQAARLLENIKALDTLLADKMPDPPSMLAFQRHLEHLPTQAAAEVPAPPRDTEQTQPAPSASAAPAPESGRTTGPAPASSPTQIDRKPAAAAPAEPETISGEQDAIKSLNAALQSMRQASLFLLQKDLKNPLAYRYRRIAGWAKLEKLPPNTDGATQLPPPAPQVVTTLEELHAAANWPALIQNAEQKLSQFIFWFDLNRMVAEGLAGLGAGYEDALAAVCQETAYLLQRLPELASLSFSDGMPFAAEQTRTWLQTIAFGRSNAASAAGARTGAAEAQPDDQALIAKARALALKKQVVKAVELLQQPLLSSASGRRRMQWRLAIVQVLCGVKKHSQAVPHLQQILTDIDQFHLEEWDPGLAVEALSAAWKVFSLPTAGESTNQAPLLLDRIARIDPAAALRLSK
jgi:type VI secretion system protein VasJ